MIDFIYNIGFILEFMCLVMMVKINVCFNCIEIFGDVDVF